MVTAQDKLTVFFNEIDKSSLPLVGGKGANLGEMTKAKFPVPPGFAVTVPSYELFLAENKIAKAIKDVLEITDVHDPDQLNNASRRIQKIIKLSHVPKTVREDIVSSYRKLKKTTKVELVAVRSSATAEDLPDASFAGQQATYLNIKGDTNVINAVRDCWASLFTARAIFYLSLIHI